MLTSVPSSTLIQTVLKPTGRRRRVRSRAAALLFAVFLLPTLVLAQPPADAEESDKEAIRALLRRVEQLEARVAQLEASRQPGASAMPAPTPAPVSAPIAMAQTPAEQEPEDIRSPVRDAMSDETPKATPTPAEPPDTAGAVPLEREQDAA